MSAISRDNFRCYDLVQLIEDGMVKLVTVAFVARKSRPARPRRPKQHPRPLELGDGRGRSSLRGAQSIARVVRSDCLGSVTCLEPTDRGVIDVVAQCKPLYAVFASASDQ